MLAAAGFGRVGFGTEEAAEDGEGGHCGLGGEMLAGYFGGDRLVGLRGGFEQTGMMKGGVKQRG